jgi:peptidoglycan/xylan/chitin deacetylase (PgdA/CDA1 family)
MRTRRSVRSHGAGVILLYHRVAELHVDPWELAVTPVHFDEHLRVINQCATVLSLHDMTRHLADGSLPPRAVAVTFDDGYVDNVCTALPLLEHHDTPATFFVTTGVLNDQENEFWWDELQSLLLPSIDSSDGPQRPRPWRAWEPAPSVRHATYAAAWQQMQTLGHDERRARLTRLAEDIGRSSDPIQHRAMSVAELQQLSRSSLTEVGAHTVSHARLSAIDAAQQRRELVDSRRHLEDLLEQPVTAMSYPFGGEEDYSAETVSLAREAGYACACTAATATVHTGTDLFQLPRCFVPNVAGDRFEALLDRWLEGA